MFTVHFVYSYNVHFLDDHKQQFTFLNELVFGDKYQNVS